MAKIKPPIGVKGHRRRVRRASRKQFGKAETRRLRKFWKQGR